jgi:hypothetical protein
LGQTIGIKIIKMSLKSFFIKPKPSEVIVKNIINDILNNLLEKFNVCLKILNKSDELYLKFCIEFDFREILQVYKITNKILETKFLELKEILYIKNKGVGSTNLYHGTSEINIESIIQNGFDISKNINSVHGIGTYFARNPCMAKQYCKEGKKLLYCEVLIGKHDIYKGKKINDTELDNIVDNFQQPTIVTTKHNYGAIPRYLIIFK